jgi:hypothetical protein
MTGTGLQPTSVSLRTRTDMVLETSVLSIFNQLTRLEARENFIKFSRRESFKSYTFVICLYFVKRGLLL